MIKFETINGKLCWMVKPEPCPACGGTGKVIKEPCDAQKSESATQDPLSVTDATQPEYEVGDWVRTKDGDGLIVEIPLTMPEIMLTNWKKISIHAFDIERKLDPSEVIVNIGCLSGTVRKSSTGGDYFRLLGVDGEASIDFVMLDTPTRELVQSLLKSQEEKQSD